MSGLVLMTLLLSLVPTQAPTAPHALTVVAAGDIACDATTKGGDPDDASPEGCHMAGTAQLIAGVRPDLVLPLGDEQYQDGALSAFRTMYAKTWGTFLSIMRPVPGNHEYETPHAAGYFAYFSARAGDPLTGYYSFDRGGWHFIAINANCGDVGGCNEGSPEERWLKADLARHKAGCILAYWHQPRFSSGFHHSDPAYIAFWQDLYAAKADLVLNGHDHLYERFGPQTPAGAADPGNGIREIIAGTGGRSHYVFKKIEPNSEARNNTAFGILILHLRKHDYDWAFKPEAGKSFTDHGSARCHR